MILLNCDPSLIIMGVKIGFLNEVVFDQCCADAFVIKPKVWQ